MSTVAVALSPEDATEDFDPFASGLIDSFQYFGGSLAGYFLGLLLDKSWGYYFYFMAPFGLVGGVLMVSILGRVSLAKPSH